MSVRYVPDVYREWSGRYDFEFGRRGALDEASEYAFESDERRRRGHEKDEHVVGEGK
jgi:hypothetical protein